MDDETARRLAREVLEQIRPVFEAAERLMLDRIERMHSAAVSFTVCGDVDAGELVETCECGKARGAGKPHGYDREDVRRSVK